MRLLLMAFVVLVPSLSLAEDDPRVVLEKAKSQSAAAVPSSSPAGRAKPKTYKFPESEVRVFDGHSPMEPPYCAVYRDGGRTLVFLAARHADKEQTESFPPVRRALDAKPAPQLAIVEMTDAQAHDRRFVADFASEAEPHYTAKLAGERGIPVLGAEFPPAEELAAVARSGGEFTVKDYEGFYIVRTLLGGRRRERIAKIVEEFRQEFGIKDSAELFAEREFRDWYRTKNRKEFSPESLEIHETWPLQGASLFTRRVAAAACYARDIRLGRSIAEAMSSNDRVLVVYGAGHQVELAAALEKMFGKPEVGPCP